MKISKSSLKTYLTYLVVLIPILGQYGILTRSFTIADAFLIPGLALAIFFSISKEKIIINDSRFLIFSLWITIISIIMSLVIPELSLSSSLISIIKCLVYSLIILFFSKEYIDIDKSLDFYSKTVTILSILIFVQIFIYKITGIIKPWVINSSLFPAVFVNDDYFSGGYLVTLGGSSFRASSIFSEPALYAQYVCPCLIMNIFRKTSKKNYLLLALVTLSTIFTKSANGLVYVIITWVFAIIYNIYEFIKKKEKNIKSLYIFVAILIVLATPLLYPKIKNIISGSDSSLLSRISEITDSRGETSGSMRVVRGWKIYYGLRWYEKIFGIGIGNIVEYLDVHNSIVTTFKEAYNGYMSGLSSIFVNSGFIGGILFLYWWIYMFIKNKSVVKSLLIFLLLYLIASNSFFSLNFVMVIIMIITISKKENIESFEI